MSLFDTRYKAILGDRDFSSDISDDINSLAIVSIALERDDFQMLPAKVDGIESVANEARDRVIQRFVDGADLNSPATINLYKDNEMVTTQTIDDLTIKLNQDFATFETKELSLWEKIKADKDTKYKLILDCFVPCNDEPIKNSASLRA